VVPEARESDGWFTLRNRLAAPADGWADWATGKERVNGKADVTVMFVNLIDLCGLAAGIGREAATPAPVVLVSHVCVAKHSVLHEVRVKERKMENGERERGSNLHVSLHPCHPASLHFFHQIGHLAGLRHDADHDSTNWPNPDAHGLRLMNARPPYRTVMGYPCTERGQPECPRLNVLSNPGVVVNGVASGIAGRANNARVFNAAGGWMARLFEGVRSSGEVEGEGAPTADGAAGGEN